MNWSELQQTMTDFLREHEENRVSAEDALRPDLAGMQIYDDPLMGVAAANDPLFLQLQTPGVVGEGALLPADWLADAVSVISFFLPFTERVRCSNRLSADTASDEWLHARIEGQRMVEVFAAALCEKLREAGYDAVCPATDPRFGMIAPFASNWSERHVAYICGLGTFGVSRGLITAKGMAGRFGSIVVNAPLPVTPRPYSDPFAYCILCGACQTRCPVQAIDIKRGVVNGKDQTVCSAFVEQSRRPPHGPNRRARYGCGKCQVGVPCESRLPLHISVEIP